MKLLIERKANVFALSDSLGENILHILTEIPPDEQSQDDLFNFINYLFSLPTLDTTQLLTQQSSTFQDTPLLAAAQFCSFPIVQQLIKFKSPINHIDSLQNSILHCASLNRDFPIIFNLFHHYILKINFN